MAESNSTSVRRRVKLYLLNDERQWDDRGTGHVSYAYVDRLQGMSLIVRSEIDGSVLLESKILPDTAYQKQQETLIVWTEGDSYDLALSFQEKSGCDEIWEKICQVQGKDPSVEVTQDIVEETDEGERFEDSFGQSSHSLTTPSSSSQLELPPAEMSRLGDIEAMFAADPSCGSGAGALTPIRRERLATAIERDGYALKLLELFRMCEDLENVDGLHRLYNIFKNMFLLNKMALFETVLADEDHLMDVVGVFEYDPAKPEPVHHREYLRTKARFRDVLPLTGDGCGVGSSSERWEKLVKTIHQTYRVQYIQDVILPSPSMFEENMLSALNSFVFFNKVEIVKMLQEDGEILKRLFRKLTDDGTDEEKRRELVLFLKEFCSFSNTLQPMNRDEFFKTLSSLGILETLASIWSFDDPDAKAAATDIFSFIVESNPSMVREFALQEARNDVNDDDMLVNMAIDQMKCDPDPELGAGMQLMGTLRILLDPENMLANTMKAEKSEFLSCFYKHCMPVLTAPLLANTTDDQPSRDDFQTSQLLALILDLLTFCVEHHSFHIRAYLIGRDLLRRVLILTKSRHAFLALSALRFMRRLVQLKDDTYFRYIIKNNHFRYIEEAFLANGSKYNLINSAIIELFEYIRTEDLKTLYSHIVENHFKAFENVGYVQTFKSLSLKWEQQQERLREKTTSAASAASTPSPGASLEPRQSGRYRRDAHYVDADEEIWFEKDEEYEATTDGLDTKMDSEISEISELSKLLDNSKKAKEAVTSDFDTPPRLFQRSTSITIAPLRSPSPGHQPVIGGDSFVMASSSAAAQVNGVGAAGTAASVAAVPACPADSGTKRPHVSALVDYPDDEDENDDDGGGETVGNGSDDDGGGSAENGGSGQGRHSAKKPRLTMS